MHKLDRMIVRGANIFYEGIGKSVGVISSVASLSIVLGIDAYTKFKSLKDPEFRAKLKDRGGISIAYKNFHPATATFDANNPPKKEYWTDTLGVNKKEVLST